jgi:hypothetical protein
MSSALTDRSEGTIRPVGTNGQSNMVVPQFIDSKPVAFQAAFRSYPGQFRMYDFAGRMVGIYLKGPRHECGPRMGAMPRGEGLRALAPTLPGVVYVASGPGEGPPIRHRVRDRWLSVGWNTERCGAVNPALSHPAGELVHVEIVPPCSDLAVADLEGPHDRQLKRLVG